MSNIESNNEILREQIKLMLSKNIGIKIEIAGSIFIENHGNAEFIVGGVEEKEPYQVNEWKETFQDIDRALNYLITKRTQDKLGNDFWS